MGGLRMFVERPMTHFLETLSSSSATPGGGSVSALGGALSASLISMVASLSGENEELQRIHKDSEILRAECTKLIDDDVKAFDAVMRSFKMPKGTDEEKAVRKEAIQSALKDAVRVPLIVAGRCTEILRLSGKIARICNRNAISDVGVAALMAYASMRGASMNVRINLASIDDEDFNLEVVGELRDLRSEAEGEMKEAVKFVESILS
jgi:formiminotetrahydrofolate cyclodeaminase